LAHFLNLSLLELEILVNAPHYQRIKIKKKKGGYREIYAPVEALKSVQRKLNYYLQALYFHHKPAFVHGFTLEKKMAGFPSPLLANARHHVDSNYLLNVDMADFFTSIRSHVVFKMLSTFLPNASEITRKALTRLLTYEGCLVTGSPASPVVSNLVCLAMDNELSVWAASQKINFSRYADDLSFSTHRKFDMNDVKNIESILAKYGFKLNPKKTRMQSPQKRKEVTGIVINQQPAPPIEYRKKVRAMLHDWNRRGLLLAAIKHFGPETEFSDEVLKTKFINKLNGMIRYCEQILGYNHHHVSKWKQLFNRLHQNQQFISAI
jgi:RNA-directed DNA polymerase